MPLERRVVEAGLLAKGFRRTDGDHVFFIYHSSAGRKSSVRTKTSHGTSYRDIADALVSQMAKQCRITTPDFRSLIACPLSQNDYEAMLLAQGLVEPPS